MKRTLLIAALFCCVAAAEFSARAQSPSTSTSPAPAFRVDAKAVWIPSASVLSDIRKVCSAGDPAQHETCFVDSMKSAGASAEAVEFVKAFASNGLAYVRAFRDTGRVSIAYIEYLFRANEMDGVLLVNGTPPMIDVDDDSYVSSEGFRTNMAFEALKNKYPQVSIWPGDRFDTQFPMETPTSAGGQTFMVEYLLQDGCHACARIGTARVIFEFDADGKLQNTKLIGVTPSSSAPGSSQGPQDQAPPGLEVIHSVVGRKFSITLIANHTTGFAWRLATSLDTAIVKKLGDYYSEQSFGLLGGGGEEVWTFEAVRKGQLELDFEYIQPFEKNLPPVKTAKFRVEIE